MSDPIEELSDLLREAGVTVTFDRGRDITHPCTFCGSRPVHGGVHDLVDIGTYPNGNALTRPVCEACRPIAEAHNAHPLLNLQEIERRTIAKALRFTNGNRNEAAKLLGIGRSTLYRHLAEARP
jgi:DNA-binding NtrC family response regulator